MLRGNNKQSKVRNGQIERRGELGEGVSKFVQVTMIIFYVN